MTKSRSHFSFPTTWEKASLSWAQTEARPERRTRKFEATTISVWAETSSISGMAGDVQIFGALPVIPRGSTEVICSVEIQTPYTPSIGQTGVAAIITGGSQVISLVETGPSGRNDLVYSQFITAPKIRVSGEFPFGFNVDS